jgi:membrane associated rhomboid family serine protease
MILPLTVDYPYDRKPWATISLIGVNVLVFVVTLGLSDEAISSFMLWPDSFAPWQWWTSGFLHAGILHLAGNMLFLWVYGRYVEERIGPARFLLLYAIFGPLESLACIAFAFGEPMPAVGASGVISAFMGVVLAAAPSARVKTFIWWGPVFRIVPIHAGLILGFWVIEQIAMAAIGVGGIAFASHLGGFAAGAAAGLLMRFHGRDAWSMADNLQSREDVEARLKSSMYADLARYHRNGREAAMDRPGPNHIPQWMSSKPAAADPYEEEQLRRWNAGKG